MFTLRANGRVGDVGGEGRGDGVGYTDVAGHGTVVKHPVGVLQTFASGSPRRAAEVGVHTLHSLNTNTHLGHRTPLHVHSSLQKG